MRALSANQLLNVWEEELTSNAVERALSLLVACTQISREELAQWNIGRRDAGVLTLRELTFGSQLVCVENCPRCSEQLELNFAVSDVRVEPITETGATLALQADNYDLVFRLPDSRDLQAIADHQEIATGRDLLLERCLIKTLHNGQAISASDLPPHVSEAITQCMAEADPGAWQRPIPVPTYNSICVVFPANIAGKGLLMLCHSSGARSTRGHSAF
jgi:hypothetical protein